MCVVERRRVQGRAQEWNISRGELAALTRLGLLSEADLETAVASEWVRVRTGCGLEQRSHWVRGRSVVGHVGCAADCSARRTFRRAMVSVWVQPSGGRAPGCKVSVCDDNHTYGQGEGLEMLVVYLVLRSCNFDIISPPRLLLPICM